jgi:hypothetical protein
MEMVEETTYQLADCDNLFFGLIVPANIWIEAGTVYVAFNRALGLV